MQVNFFHTDLMDRTHKWQTAVYPHALARVSIVWRRMSVRFAVVGRAARYGFICHGNVRMFHSSPHIVRRRRAVSQSPSASPKSRRSDEDEKDAQDGAQTAIDMQSDSDEAAEVAAASETTARFGQRGRDMVGQLNCSSYRGLKLHLNPIFCIKHQHKLQFSMVKIPLPSDCRFPFRPKRGSPGWNSNGRVYRPTKTKWPTWCGDTAKSTWAKSSRSLWSGCACVRLVGGTHIGSFNEIINNYSK